MRCHRYGVRLTPVCAQAMSRQTPSGAGWGRDGSQVSIDLILHADPLRHIFAV
jgi:hypothetical protein